MDRHLSPPFPPQDAVDSNEYFTILLEALYPDYTKTRLSWGGQVRSVSALDNHTLNSPFSVAEISMSLSAILILPPDHEDTSCCRACKSIQQRAGGRTDHNLADH